MKHFDAKLCLGHNDQIQPIPDQATWMIFREIYQNSVLDPNIPLSTQSGFRVPIEVRQIPNKGRGVVSVGPIPKGTLISDASQSAVFEYDEEAEWNSFLCNLPTSLACDVLEWAYGEIDEDTGLGCVTVDLDENSLINHDYDPNCGLEDDDDDYNIVALRDIAAGEELVMNYGDFEDQDHIAVKWYDEMWRSINKEGDAFIEYTDTNSNIDDGSAALNLTLFFTLSLALGWLIMKRKWRKLNDVGMRLP